MNYKITQKSVNTFCLSVSVACPTTIYRREYIEGSRSASPQPTVANWQCMLGLRMMPRVRKPSHPCYERPPFLHQKGMDPLRQVPHAQLRE